jgi:hypothetical protein
MAETGWPHLEPPFHRGEQAIQSRIGMRDRMDRSGRRTVRDYMPDQHRTFYAQLPFIAVGARDGDGQPWASILTGPPGFAASPAPRTLHVAALPGRGDPLHGVIAAAADVGLLGIELHTRRRNRINGTVAAADAGGFTVRVAQSFGNCPQYIQKRAIEAGASGTGAAPPAAAQHLDRLDAAARALITRADTFLIATAFHDRDRDGGGSSGGANEGADVSHRGGRPGFVRIDDDGGGRTVLTFPDFAGNRFFNTLGNLLLEPRAGLLFLDFTTGGLLHLAGEAEIIWDGPELASFAGAERLVRFRIDRAIRRAGALPLRWSFREQAPQLAGTGTWDAAMAC